MHRGVVSYPEDWGPLHSSQKMSEVRRNLNSCCYSEGIPAGSLCHSPEHKTETRELCVCTVLSHLAKQKNNLHYQHARYSTFLWTVLENPSHHITL